MMNIQVGDKISYWDDDCGIWRNTAVIAIFHHHAVGTRPNGTEIWVEWKDIHPPF